MAGIVIICGLLSTLLITSFMSGGFQQTSQEIEKETAHITEIETGILTINARKNNQFSNGEYVSDYYTYTYDCKWHGNDVKCEGEIQYIGPPNIKVSGTHLDLWCVDKRGCIVDTDRVDIKSIDKQSYTLVCHIGERKDIKVNLEIRDGTHIYYSPPYCK